MTDVFRELRRILRPDGWVAFEVGEERKGSLMLEKRGGESRDAGRACPGVCFDQLAEFYEDGQLLGVDNNVKGTSSNRIVLFCKGESKPLAKLHGSG